MNDASKNPLRELANISALVKKTAKKRDIKNAANDVLNVGGTLNTKYPQPAQNKTDNNNVGKKFRRLLMTCFTL